MRFFLFLMFFSLLNSKAMAKQTKSDVVYETDDRVEYYEVESELLKKMSESTAILVHKNRFQTNGSFTQFASYLTKGGFLCQDQRFFDQPNPGHCSGFLISNDTLVTAGHCVKDQNDCDSNSWIFNFKLSHPGHLPDFVDTQDVYECQSIIKTNVKINPGNGNIDFAVIKLNRPTPYSGLTISTKEVQIGQLITMIGYPSGLPQKITSNAKITEIKPNGFISNLDAFGGNSGSMVIDQKSGEVIGILTYGREDYIFDNKLQCSRVNYLKDHEAGEYVSSIQQIK